MANIGEKKNRIITALFNLVSKKGRMTEKMNNLDQDARIYTKKIKLDYDMGEGVTGRYLSLSCDNKEFKGTQTGDLRLATVNRDKKWVSLFINNFSIKDLNKLFEYVTNKNK